MFEKSDEGAHAFVKLIEKHVFKISNIEFFQNLFPVFLIGVLGEGGVSKGPLLSPSNGKIMFCVWEVESNF